ncbi:MAG: GAF and HD-GYP domain-containing protein [Spirochaetia bacterium]
MAHVPLSELAKIISGISNIKDSDLLYEYALLNLRAFTNASAGSLYLKEGNDLVIVYTQNDALSTSDKLKSMRIPINKSSLAGYVGTTGETLNVPDVSQISDDSPYKFDSSTDLKTGFKTISVLCLPMKIKNNQEVVGIIQLFNCKAHPDSSNDEIIPFSSDTGESLDIIMAVISLVLQRIQDLRSISLRLISVVQLRDPEETGSHISRVGGYTIEIYENYAMKNWIPREQIDETKVILRFAAMLHDIGKVAISDTILKKPGPLTAREFEIIKMHTIKGAEIFQEKRTDFDEMVHTVVLEHHENWDGTGYPYGKKGDEISIFSQMVSIADVFDALVSRRTYKESWSMDQAIQEIKSLSGSKFNPQLVDCFIDALPFILRVRSTYPY